MNRVLGLGMASVVVLAAAAMPSIAGAQTRRFNVPSGEAAKTIPEFARQAGVRISAPVSGLGGKRTAAIVGEQDVRAALAKLIAGLGLEVASDDGAGIVLRRAALAQDAAFDAPKAAPAEVEELVISGTRASVRRGVAVKRAAEAIIDTVSASEIGQLPDFNAGDALKRIPGVNTLLYQGEPRFVITRGFNQTYNDVLIDGFSLASTDMNMGTSYSGGRQISMEVLPSNLASHIDVIKSATPANSGNFVGGLVNFSTNSAFDFGGDMLAGSVKGGVAPDKKENGGDHFAGQATIAGAKRFGPDNQFGLYLSTTYWQRYINVPQFEAGGQNWYTAAGVPSTTYGGNGLAVPRQQMFYNYQNKRRRASVQGRLDWHPTTDFSAYLSAYHFYQFEDSDRNDLNAQVTGNTRASNQTPTSGTLSNLTQNVQFIDHRWNRHVTGLYGRFDKSFSDKLELDGGLSWSTSRVRSSEVVEYFEQTGLSFNYDLSGPVPTFTPVNPSVANDLSRYGAALHRYRFQRLAENRYDGQLNLKYNSQTDDRGFGASVGGSLVVNRQDQTFTRTGWTGMGYTAADVVSGETLCGYGCHAPIPLISQDKAYAAWQANLAKATMTPDLSANSGNTYATDEDVLGLYAQLQYRTDDVYMVGGVRVEKTWTGSNSTRAVNGVYVPVEASRDYTNVLPSALVVWTMAPDRKLRAGVSMTVSRPNFSSSSLKGGALNTMTDPPTLSTGNPNLKPRRATNVDLGHDWYLSGGRGLVSVAGFYKWIKDDVFSYAALQTVDGVAVPVLVSQARNTDDTVRAWGVEFSASHDLTFLPAPFDGFGVSANLTLSKAHFPVTLSDGSVRELDFLPGQARRIVNASLYYDKDKLHGRIAWNHLGKLWDDRYPNYDPAGFYQNRTQQPTNNIDLQLSYDVTDHLSVTFDGLNLTKQGFKYKYGRDEELVHSRWTLPAQLLFGVKLKM